MKTFVYIDHFKGEVQPASWEALGLAKSFGTAIALVFGSGADAIAKAAFEYGADEVIVVDDAALTDYRAEPYASTLSALASSPTPDLILFPTTARTRELAAMSAVDLNTGVLTDVAKFEMNGDTVGCHPSHLRRQSVGEDRLLGQAGHGDHPRARLPQTRTCGRQDWHAHQSRSQNRRADNRRRLLCV